MWCFFQPAEFFCILAISAIGPSIGPVGSVRLIVITIEFFLFQMMFSIRMYVFWDLSIVTVMSLAVRRVGNFTDFEQNWFFFTKKVVIIFVKSEEE